MENEIENQENEIKAVETTEEAADNETNDENKVNRECAHIMSEIMDTMQQAINRLGELVGGLETLHDQTHREDILETVNQIKEMIGDESEQWDTANDWLNFYLGIDTKEDEEEPAEQPEPDTENGAENVDEE